MVTLSKSTGKEGGPDPVLGTNFRKIHALRVLTYLTILQINFGLNQASRIII